jgi:hypothetical protein
MSDQTDSCGQEEIRQMDQGGMRVTDQCGDCIHAFVGEVKVDFDGPGYLDFECEMENAMTDEDCEMCNEGRCPYYKQMEDEE